MRVALALFLSLSAAFFIWSIGRDLVPPRSVTFAAGMSGGGYHAIATRYAEILARDGIETRILETAGSVENVDRLSSGEADVALLQGGVHAEGGAEALGAMFYEPLFVFAQADADLSSNPGDWAGLGLAVGPEGSGTRAASRVLLAASGIAPADVTLLPVGGADAVLELRAGEADLALFVAPLAAPYLQPLFNDPDVRLLRLLHLDAIARRMDHAEIVTLHAGAISLRPVLPQQSTDLVAMVARLVGQRDLHPALVDRLVMAAREIHGERDQITPEGAFPATSGISMPIDVNAYDIITDGPSALSAYLPYWAVAQVNRIALLALPIVFLLFPLLRSLPGLYQWRMRSQVFRHYREIREIDEELREAASPTRLSTLRDRLDAIDAELAELRLPVAYRHLAYTARLHVDLVRSRINEKQHGLDSGAGVTS
ncbi:NMT1/THI5 like protein [Roseivivax jejudonensis]|uniref:NMT1/THI5 like protein n=1 Tax=Roseivivax jejudonensis TaxID=1529041 RepID=A0A1X6Y848_9RHOB|nr:TAXI family TRAP transporter solute-binding subunit [Roseivivax jejudonensis]SLN13467.1 NMT1/THI5 like protein [Roseivivax jejudonensis]